MSRLNHTLALPAVLILAAAVSAFAPANASAANKVMHRRHHATTASNAAMTAKVNEGDARATALASVTGGTVKSEKLETVHGRLVYHYVIELPNSKKVEKVNVDADTGTIVKSSSMHHHHMSKKESKQEAKEQTKKPR